MPKKITIRGIIGLSDKATPEHLEDSITDSGSDDIEVTFASPGGFVSSGIEMSNMIRAYAGHTTAIITGQAASMASYMPMVFDHVAAYDNTVFMIHNPMGGVLGADHREAARFTEHMIGLRNLLARAYSKKTGKSIDEIHQMMADETFLYGQEIVDHGFADELIKSEDGATNKSEAIALAKSEMIGCQAKMKESESNVRSDFERAAAYLKTEPQAAKTTPPHEREKTEEATKMTLNEFLAANPAEKAAHEALIASARTEGETAGIKTGKEEGIAQAKAISDVVTPIISSSHYPDALKTRVIEKAQAGDVEAVKDYVSMYDMTSEGIATAKAIEEQGKETPASGQMTTAEKSEVDLKAHQARIAQHA